MKKILILNILLFSITLYAGTPKNVGTAVELTPGVPPSAEYLDFNAYIASRPGEIISVGVLGGMYIEQPTFGMCLVNVGNFATPWSAGDALVWDYYLDGGFAGTQSQILTSGGTSQYNMTPYTFGFFYPTVSGTVLLDGSGLENVGIYFSEVYRANKGKPIKAEKDRTVTYTAADGTYSFLANCWPTTFLVVPFKTGYTFDPPQYQDVVSEDITDWDFTATVGPDSAWATGNNTNPGDPVYIIFDPIFFLGSLINTEIVIFPPSSDLISVTASISCNNLNVPIPENVDLSYEIDLVGSTGPEIVRLYFPIIVPPIDNIIFFDGANWTVVPDADWSIPGEVSFTYNFSVLRGTGTFVLGRDNPLPVTLAVFTATSFQNEFVNISWTTESETAMNVYNLYRSMVGDGNQILIHTENATNTTTTHEYAVEDYEVDSNVTYNYWLEAIGIDGSTSNFGPTSVTIYEEVVVVIESTILIGNFPNPFNPKTFIQFDVKEDEKAKLTIYNIKGEVVEKTDFITGNYNYEWNAEGLSSGVYFYKLSSESYTKISKMLLLK